MTYFGYYGIYRATYFTRWQSSNVVICILNKTTSSGVIEPQNRHEMISNWVTSDTKPRVHNYRAASDQFWFGLYWSFNLFSCADPGIFTWGGGGGSRSECQKTALTMFFVQLVLSVVYQWFISKQTIISQGFRGGGGGGRGGPTVSKGGGGWAVSIFFGGGGGGGGGV